MQLISSLQQFDIAPAEYLTLLAAVGLTLFFLLAALCAPLLGVLTECAYIARRKVFYDKCATQIAQAALCCCLFVAGVVGTAAGLYIYWFQPEMLDPPLVWRPLISAAPFGTLIFLLILYIASWKLLKNLRFLHLPLGFAGAVLGLGLLGCCFLLALALQEPPLPELLWTEPLAVGENLLAEFLATPVYWLMLGYLFCTGVSAGSGLAQLWLIVRRNKADFGRDYYVFAMHYCARFALVFVVFATALAGVVYWQFGLAVPPDFTQPFDPGIMLIAGGLPLSCLLLWLVIAKSETPLRHKPGAFFACVFLFIALCAQLLILINGFPMA